MAAAAASRGDITEPEIIKDVLTSLCRPPRSATKSAIDAHFADNVVLKSALFRVAGREGLFRFFRAWQFAFDDAVDVLDVAVHGDRALARIRHNLTPRVLNTPLPIIGHVPGWARHLLTFPFIVSAEFVFEDTPRGKRITAWTEDISAYTLIYNVPLAEKVWSQAVEPAGGAIATHVGAALDAAAPAVDRFLAERVGWKSGLAQI